ncbi:FCD domain-containing protein [Sinomonas sp. ASV322]|uniref:FadR/GntR family transcriptional regulator n=1 Tax=Sinomonas sp. ASV322 TaxID=3041920 RepID=UPI0027DDC6BC|nr:FCD domain-containing protein [Sinomonas sp. ASV322]MDQ4504288.1 FCD domain-containing protein [Sinomonas sp. ASV322]
MRSVSRKSLVDQAIDQLREQIGSGSWPIGHRLPAEAKLAEELGMSRAPVREATRALVHVGLLASRQGAGTFVIAADESDAALRRQLGAAEVMDVIEARRGLDIAVARAAAARRTSTDLDRLADILQLRRQAADRGDETAFVQADLDYHVGVADASHNRILRDMYRGISEVISSTVELTDCFAPGSGTLLCDHEELLSAIRDQDQTAAAAAALTILHNQESAVRHREPNLSDPPTRSAGKRSQS